jgi:dicarboxylate transporter 10
VTKGLYSPIRDRLVAEGAEPTLAQRAAAAMATGSVGSVFANAVDVVKIRQFDRPDRYASLRAAGREIAAAEGVVAGLLTRGLSASVPRGAAIAAGEIASYDYTKSLLRRRFVAEAGAPEPFALHAATSLITGVVAATVAAPFDLLKSRVMASEDRSVGFATALREALKKDGPRSLFRGWTPAYLRLGPHAILTFPLYEQLRSAVGLGNL